MRTREDVRRRSHAQMGACNRRGDGLDVEPTVLEQMVEDAPSEGAMRYALESQAHFLCPLQSTGSFAFAAGRATNSGGPAAIDRIIGAGDLGRRI